MNIKIKSKPTALFCTFSTSAAKQVTVKSRVGQKSSSAWEFKLRQLQAGGIAPGGSKGPVQGWRVSLEVAAGTGCPEPMGANSWSTLASPSGLEEPRASYRRKQKGKVMERQQLCASMASHTT